MENGVKSGFFGVVGFDLLLDKTMMFLPSI